MQAWLGQRAVVIAGPAQISRHGLGHHIGVMTAHHGDMVFKAVLGSEPHQAAQIRNLCNGDAAVHGKGVIGKLTLVQRAFQRACTVVQRQAETGHRPRLHLTLHRAKAFRFAIHAAPIISDRSTVTTVIPAARSSFSE